MRRKYISHSNRSTTKKSYVFNKKHMIALAVFFILLLARFSVVPFMESKINYTPEIFEYNGVIDFWDISSLTLKGSKYSVIRTICSEYAKKYNSFRINFTALSELSPVDSILLNIKNGNTPDIIRLKIDNYEANTVSAITDTKLAEDILKLYEPYIQRSVPYEDKLVIDMYCDIGVILINKDLANELNATYDRNRITYRNDFIAFLEKLSVGNITEEYNIIDFPKEDIYSYLPFTLTSDGSYSIDFLNSVSTYLPTEHSDRTQSDCQNDFLSGKTVLYCADLDMLNTLIRRKIQNRGFDFDYILYPCDDSKIVFVNDITSYVFNDSNDFDKNTVLKDFALYMLSGNASQYTQNLGKLNCTSTVFDYDNCPYMKEFKDKKAIYYTYRDFEIKAIYAKLSSFYN